MNEKPPFELDRTTRLETRTSPWSRRRRWHGLLPLVVTAAVVLGAAGMGAPQASAAHGETARAAPAGAVKPPIVPAADFDHANSAIQRRIQNATVMIAILSPDWKLHGVGSGTLLADQKIDGRKAIATILHVGGTQDLEDKSGLRLVAIDHDGAILGVVRPFARVVPAYVQAVGRDQPELLGFDPAYRINTAKLAAIQGVAVAPALPAGMMAGQIHGLSGVAEGDSGGGWYDAKGRLIGVGDLSVVYPDDVAILHGQNLAYAVLEGVAIDDPKATTSRQISLDDKAGVQGLGAPLSLAQIRETTVSGTSKPILAAPGKSYEATGYGYPMGMAMHWRTDLAPAPDLVSAQAADLTSLSAAFQEETTPASSGMPDTAYARAYLAMVARAGARLRQDLTAPSRHTVLATAADRTLAAPAPGETP